MIYYNLKVIVNLKEDIAYENTYEKISNFIANSMLYDDNLKKLHEENTYKLYSFCSPYPFEKDQIYIKGRTYAFDIRFLDLKFAMKIKQLLEINTNENFKYVMSQIETHEYRKIHKLISLTPSICTTLKGDYKIDGDMDLIKHRLISGAEKKYNQIYGTSIKSDFILDIQQKNIKPIKLPYKQIFFLGNKFEISVKEDDDSQKLAFILFVTGILEKNSQGYGFCKAI